MHHPPSRTETKRDETLMNSPHHFQIHPRWVTNLSPEKTWKNITGIKSFLGVSLTPSVWDKQNCSRQFCRSRIVKSCPTCREMLRGCLPYSCLFHGFLRHESNLGDIGKLQLLHLPFLTWFWRSSSSCVPDRFGIRPWLAPCRYVAHSTITRPVNAWTPNGF